MKVRNPFFIIFISLLLFPIVVSAMSIEERPSTGETQDAQSIFDPGGWGFLPGLTESVFIPDDVFSPDGIFMPGGWGLEGIDVETFAGEPPGRVSLWWRDIKERVSLAFTFDPFEKNQKRLKYTEERMRIAYNYAQNVQGPNDVKRIEESVRRAHSMMSEIGKDSERWLEPGNVDSQRILGNVMRHQLNRENSLDYIEGRLHDNNLTGIREMRQDGLKISQQLLNEVESHELPKQVKRHISGLKKQFAEYENEVGSFRAERQQMIQQKVNGDGEAALRLNQTEKERRARVRYREVMQMRVKRMPKGEVPQDPEPSIELHEWEVQQLEGSGQTDEPPMETVSGLDQTEISPAVEMVGGHGTGQQEEPPVEE